MKVLLSHDLSGLNECLLCWSQLHYFRNNMAGKRTSTAKRCILWTVETVCLLSVWHKRSVEMFPGSPNEHNGSVDTMVSKEMKSSGYEKSNHQVKI